MRGMLSAKEFEKLGPQYLIIRGSDTSVAQGIARTHCARSVSVLAGLRWMEEVAVPFVQKVAQLMIVTVSGGV